MTTIVGIDYSMTSPGVCVITPSGIFLYAFNSSKVEKNLLVRSNMTFKILPSVDSYKTPIERFDKLARKVIDVINTHDINDAAFYMEGYSMGSKGQVFHIAENAAVLKLYLYRSGFEVNEIAPTAVKKFATGKGNAQKEAMHDAFMKQTGLDLRELITPNRKLGSPVTDLIDAYYVAAYGKEQRNANEASKEAGSA